MIENINHPQHYQGKIEVIDFIEDKNLNFNLGNAIKYIARAGKKDKTKYIEDLKKAIWYLERELNSKRKSKIKKGKIKMRDFLEDKNLNANLECAIIYSCIRKHRDEYLKAAIHLIDIMTKNYKE